MVWLHIRSSSFACLSEQRFGYSGRERGLYRCRQYRGLATAGPVGRQPPLRGQPPSRPGSRRNRFIAALLGVMKDTVYIMSGPIQLLVRKPRLHPDRLLERNPAPGWSRDPRRKTSCIAARAGWVGKRSHTLELGGTTLPASSASAGHSANFSRRVSARWLWSRDVRGGHRIPSRHRHHDPDGHCAPQVRGRVLSGPSDRRRDRR